MTDTQQPYNECVLDDNKYASRIPQPGIIDTTPKVSLISVVKDSSTYEAWCEENKIDLLWREPLKKLIKMGTNPLFSCQGLDKEPVFTNGLYICFARNDDSPLHAIVDYLDKYLWYFLEMPQNLVFQRSKLRDRLILTQVSRYTPIWRSTLTIRYGARTKEQQELFFSGLNYLLDRFIEHGDVPPFTYNEDRVYPIVDSAIQIEYSKIPLKSPEFFWALANILRDNKITDFSTDDMEVNTYLQMSGMFA